MAITTTAPRHTNPPWCSAAKDKQNATTCPTSKRKAETDNNKVKMLNPRGAKSKDDNDKITKSHSRTRGNKAQKNDTKHAKTTSNKDEQTDNNNNVNKPPTTRREENQANPDGDKNKVQPVANNEAEAAHETEVLHAASKNNGGDPQQPNKSERKDDSQQTSKSDGGGALKSSSDCNHSSTQGLTTRVKGTTVSKHNNFNFGKTCFYLFSLYLKCTIVHIITDDAIKHPK